jgi:hypothetical protein
MPAFSARWGRKRRACHRDVADRVGRPLVWAAAAYLCRYDGTQAAFQTSGDQDGLCRPPGSRALTEFEPRHSALTRLRSRCDPDNPEAAFIHAVLALAAGHASEAGEAIADCAEASTSWERRAWSLISPS